MKKARRVCPECSLHILVSRVKTVIALIQDNKIIIITLFTLGFVRLIRPLAINASVLTIELEFGNVSF